MTTLSGKVTLDGSSPALSAVVELHNSTGDVVDQVQVDSEGRYRYHLAEGHWVLKLWDSEGHRGSAEVSLDKDEDKSLDITLSTPTGHV
jgi:hypothetical protein